MSYTDQEIVTMVAAGPPESELAFREFLVNEARRKRIMKYLISQGAQTQDAENAYQNGSIAFFRQLRDGEYRGEASLESWLRSICYYQWLGKIRLKHRQVTLHTDEAELLDQRESESAVTRLIRGENRAKLYSILDKLGPKCRGIMLMKEQGFSEETIAAKYRLPHAGAVRNHRYKCRKKLQAKIFSDPRFANLLKQLRHDL